MRGEKKQQKRGVKKDGKGNKRANGKKPAEKPQSAEDLDSALMNYMGVTARKDVLENQLDAYFNKSDD